MTLTSFSISGSGTIPALLARIPAGEPLMLSDELEAVDLNTLLTQNCPNALILKVEGDSMCPEIEDGSWIVVSRDLEAKPGDIVVASLNGEHTLKRLERSNRKLYLVPNNGDMPKKEIKPKDDFNVLAVVVKIIRNAR
jgi:DNA polymerase V